MSGQNQAGSTAGTATAVSACLPPTAAQIRLRKELLTLIQSPPAGVSMDPTKMENYNENGQMNKWIVDLKGADGTLYEGENFELQFTFCSKFPFECPEVIFIGDHVPVNPHVYSNGHICLSILADDWSPALSISAICLSILSMLSSCTEKKAPDNDANYSKYSKASPKNTKWLFHDDGV